MFDGILHSIRSEQAPTPLDAWAAQEAKSQTTAADLRLAVAAIEARAKICRRQAKRDALLILTACAAAAGGCLM
jgi:hypothetical protein